ncbi:hypothetical protein [Nocardia sp. NPDC050710]|uniref:hypothetical protein n=1 Tax=Nocardia sp. NPDC050710 TaxID=3157220 RepID=UPI0033F3AB01
MKTDDELGAPWPDTLPAEAPVVHRNLTVTVGARQLTTLTHDHLNYWLGNLRYARGGPFMTVARADNRAAFIQTYRNSDTDYLFEVHSGVADADYLATTVHDVSEVGQLIWDWLENDWQRLDAVAWERHSLW